MAFSLSLDPEEIPGRKVADGRSLSTGDVIRGRLRPLNEREALRAIHPEDSRREIAIGVEEPDRGLIAPLDMEVIREKVWRRLEDEQEAQ